MRFLSLFELLLALFDGNQLRGCKALTVRRAVLSEMRHIADVASSLPSKTLPLAGSFDLRGAPARDAHSRCSSASSSSCCRPVACLQIPPTASCRPKLASILLPDHGSLVNLENAPIARRGEMDARIASGDQLSCSPSRLHHSSGTQQNDALSEAPG